MNSATPLPTDNGAGAELAFLQVAAANRAAIALYRQLGFATGNTCLYAEPGLAAGG